MADPIAVLALRWKQDQISGTIAHYKWLLCEAEHDMANINASLRLFETTGEAADLPPYVTQTLSCGGERPSRYVWRPRQGRPALETRQLAFRVIWAKGLSESDKVFAQTVALRAVQTLPMRARRNKVVCETKAKDVCVWRLPTEPVVPAARRACRVSPKSCSP